MDWQTHKKLLLKDPEVRRAFDDSRLEYQIARALIKARIDNKITQKDLARKLKTKQSVISRVENAKTVPSLTFLKRLSVALDVPLVVRFG
jgi:ribosome-binding protein aMBF1 (putative translation factor)